MINKYMKKIIILISILILLITTIIWKSISYNPHHLTIRTEELKSSKIDQALDGTKLIYFTDLHYGKYTKDEDINNCVDTINKLDADVIVFGGDLIDDYPHTQLTQEQKNFLISKLKSLKASQAKYYILGNHDEFDEQSKEEIETILELGGFVSLVNTNNKIYNETNSYFNIVGVDSYLKGEKDISKAYSGIDPSKYTLTFIHCPDEFDDLPLENTDYVIAGHSHGGQIYIPIFDMLYRSRGCEKYFHGKHNKNATTLDISNGVGLTSYSIRFNASAEIVYYKLKSN